MTISEDRLIYYLELLELDILSNVQDRLDGIVNKLGQLPHALHILERLEAKMATLDDLLGDVSTIAEAVGQIGPSIAQVVSDFADADSKLDAIIDALRAQTGLTPEQQAGVDAAAAQAEDVKAQLTDAADKLGTVDQAIIDAGNNPGSPVPPPAP